MIIYPRIELFEDWNNLTTICNEPEMNISICVVPVDGEKISTGFAAHITIPYFVVCNNLFPRQSDKHLRLSFRVADYFKTDDMFILTKEELEEINNLFYDFGKFQGLLNFDYAKFIWNYEHWFVDDMTEYLYGSYDKEHKRKCGYVSSDIRRPDYSTITFWEGNK